MRLRWNSLRTGEMNQRWRKWIGGGVLLVAIGGLPAVGAALSGRDLGFLFRFPPPLEILSGYRPFSWVAASLVALSVLWFISGWRRRRPPMSAGWPNPQPAKKNFPGWGWVALAWTVAWWVLAWTRFEWFAAWQRYTFFPLWLGFIVAVNALVERTSGRCLMRRQPRLWLMLFGASAVFWWMFEWLNRFVRNWHYLAVEDFGPTSYALHATLCFSTVLPAVAAVSEWLGARTGWTRRVAAGPVWAWLAAPSGGWMLLVGGAVGLVLTGAFPILFYPALWLAPLAMLLGDSVLRRMPGVWSELAQGDWRRAATWMVAALICGFFWELWNWHSVAKWIYTVPGVERWHVFEMPLLGYAGYLPFGLECLVMVERITGARRE
jgi:hypothetical protein